MQIECELTLEMFHRIEMKRFETAKTEAFKRHQKIGTAWKRIENTLMSLYANESVYQW